MQNNHQGGGSNRVVSEVGEPGMMKCAMDTKAKGAVLPYLLSLLILWLMNSFIHYKELIFFSHCSLKTIYQSPTSTIQDVIHQAITVQEDETVNTNRVVSIQTKYKDYLFGNS